MAQWRVGAIVEAVAVRGVDDGQLWLQIGGQRVPARIASGDPVGPANGERLQLRVLRDSPVIALENLPADDDAAAAINDGLRRFLPRQQSFAPLLANLAWLAERGGASLSRSIAEAAQRLWRALPDATQLSTADGLESAIKNSGAFLETHLAHSHSTDLQQALGRDLKALLTTFKQLLTRAGATVQRSEGAAAEPMPTLRGSLAPLTAAPATLAAVTSDSQALNELAGQVAGALARINTLQLINAEASASMPAWLLEVPLRRDGHPETIRFRFERHGRDPHTAEQDWTVEAALDLGVGALYARVVLHGARVGVQLRSDSAELVAALQERTNELVAVLEESGLQVDRVQCLQGAPLDSHAPRAAPHFAAPLLDIRV